VERVEPIMDEGIIVKALERADIAASPEVVRRTALFVEHLKKVNEKI